MRKRLLDYDDVMNIQREAIYKKRNHALEGERLSVDLDYMFNSTLDNIVINNKSANDYEQFINESISILGFEPDIDSTKFEETNINDLILEYSRQFHDYYKKKENFIKETLLPVITDVHRNEGHRYQRIVVPFVDETKEQIPIAADLSKAVKTKGASIVRDIERSIALSRLDADWKEHLRNMDELKDSVQAASFEQKDPLVIYKMEAYKLFEHMVLKMNQLITSYLSKGKLLLQQNQEVREAQQQRSDLSRIRTNKNNPDEKVRRAAEQAGRESVQQVQTIRNSAPKIGRNDSCPCKSGKKFKNCHGVTFN